MGPQVHPDIAGNLDLIDEQYARWLADPETVDPEWRSFLDGFALGAAQQESGSGSEVQRVALGVAAMVAAFRARGHTCATIDPLVEAVDLAPLLPARFGLETADLERPCPPCGLLLEPAPATIGELGAALRGIWCATIGAEIDALDDQQRAFLERELAGPNRPDPAAAPDPTVLAALARAERFETFIGTRLFGRTRFSLQGLESLVPGLERLAAAAAAQGASRLELGMAHRGRLNVLAHLLATPYASLIDTLRRVRDPDHPDPAGDVPYHREAEATRDFAGQALTLRVSANPSHLETVGPVLLGRARAVQTRGAGTAGVVPVVLHGDAAIAGQGIVLEAAQLGGLTGYGVGGCIHIVLDNGIGFTTAGPEGRSSRYCTAVAGLIGAPVLHVNAEDVDAVVFCCELALRYRQRFAADIFIDLVGYRRYGHNEGDDPRYTQPLVQRRIAGRPTVVEAYAARFPDGEQRRRTLDQAVLAELHAAWESSRAEPPAAAVPPDDAPPAPAITASQLDAWCTALTTIPEDFHAHPGVERLCQRRREARASGEPLDWPWAETLAFASLLADGRDVRLSGEDCRRGTFSQRHAEWIDQRSGASHWPLRQLAADGARLEVVNSPLSEAGVLAFEYGYALDAAPGLIAWEAQYGDFANGAQVIIDEYIAAGAAKWGHACPLALLLPHGLEGAGPDHSSARIERYLQLAAADGMTVVQPSTAAQYFHLLRAQAYRGRRPLVIFTPKGKLHDPWYASKPEEFLGDRFAPVLSDPGAHPARARRVLIASGKFTAELAGERERVGATDTVAIIRLERLAPFPARALAAAVARHAAAQEVVFCQEEPINQGPWPALAEPLRAALARPVSSVARPASAVPAPGTAGAYRREQDALLAAALDSRADRSRSWT